MCLCSCRKDAVVEKPKETDAQSPVSEAQADDDKKTTHPTQTPIPLPSMPPPISTCAPPKPAPRTIMSAEKVITHTHTLTLWARNQFDPPGFHMNEQTGLKYDFS